MEQQTTQDRKIGGRKITLVKPKKLWFCPENKRYCKSLYLKLLTKTDKVIFEPMSESREYLLKNKDIEKELPDILIDECASSAKMVSGLNRIGHRVIFLGKKKPDWYLENYIHSHNVVLVTMDRELDSRLTHDESILILSDVPVKDNLYLIQSKMNGHVWSDPLKTIDAKSQSIREMMLI